MTKMERIKQRGKKAAERSGSQSEPIVYDSYEVKLKRHIRNEMHSIGMGCHQWWKD